VSVNYGNNNEAIATWINDPDRDATTHNEEVYFATWNGINWTTYSTRSDAVANGWKIKDYAIATHNLYGAEALTYEYIDVDGETVNGIKLTSWNDGDLVSLHSSNTTVDTSSLLDYKLAQLAISENGIASLILQEKDILNPNDNGHLNLYLKDLNQSSTVWHTIQNSQYVTDPNQFIWDMSAKFGYLSNNNDVIYLMTQERDDNTGTTNPTSYGAIFGNPNLNLLLRAFEVNGSGSNFSLADISEPNIDNVTGFYQELKPFNYSFELNPCFPNPFSDETQIPFHVYQGGNVNIELYNLSGQQLGSIFNANLAPGDYTTRFVRRNIESGIYFYRVIMGNDMQTGKMVITD
jgi:hypothetical protein